MVIRINSKEAWEIVKTELVEEFERATKEDEWPKWDYVRVEHWKDIPDLYILYFSICGVCSDKSKSFLTDVLNKIEGLWDEINVDEPLIGTIDLLENPVIFEDDEMYC